MSASDVLSALRVPGKLVVTPTDISTAFPHGGTELGLVGEVVLEREERTYEVTGEEYGGEVVEDIYLGEQWKLVIALRGSDPDAIANIFLNSTTGTTFNLAGLSWPGTSREGRLKTSDAVKILFSPLDIKRHKGVYFRKAIPKVAENVEVIYHSGKEQVIIAGFLALRDDSTEAGSVQVQIVEDMTL